MSKRVVSLIAIVMLVSSLEGCSSVLPTDARKVPLEEQLTSSELIDYYKQALSFDTIANRNIKVDETEYVTKEVDTDTQSKLKGLIDNVASTLKSMTYDSSMYKYVSEDTYNYVKAYLNDLKLGTGEIEKYGEALGYYFVDVKYEVSARPEGTIKPQATLLGLHGAFTRDYTGVDDVSNTYLNSSVGTLNRYYTENGINKNITYDEGTQGLYMTNSNLAGFDYNENNTGIDMNETNTTKSARVVQVDTLEFNSQAGASLTESAYMPSLSLVYTEPAEEEGISGMGIYPQGNNSMKLFGFDRENLKGDLTMRYVFKTSTETGDIEGTNIYPIELTIESGIATDDATDVVVPDFLNTEFDKVIERADRAIVNPDLAGLMSGNIYSDMGVGLLVGYESNYANVIRNMSKVRRIVARDSEHNAYLLEVETVRQEGSKSTDVFGIFRDTSYVVVQQVGDKFIITDSLTKNRKLEKEPPISNDNAVKTRLYALNLAGEVSSETKEQVNSLLVQLYQAGTARVLNGPKEATIGGKKVTLEKGLYDCFDSNTSLLSTDKKEYMNSTLRNILTKEGVGTQAVYNGTVTKWIGGADNQVELTTEELVTYGSGKKAHYMQVYYLVSNINGDWSIDDMKIISEEDKKGNEVQELQNRIGK